MRIGISARLAKVAFAQAFDVAIDDVEEYWHGQIAALSPSSSPGPPTARRAPDSEHAAAVPPVHARPPARGYGASTSRTIAAEWKWDGIRVQLVHVNGETRVYSRTGDDIITQLSRDRRRAARSKACSTASCSSAARTRAARQAARRASTRCSSGSAARPSRRRCSRDYPGLRPALRRPDPRRRGFPRALPWSSAARCSKRCCRGSTPSASTSAP